MSVNRLTSSFPQDRIMEPHPRGKVYRDERTVYMPNGAFALVAVTGDAGRLTKADITLPVERTGNRPRNSDAPNISCVYDIEPPFVIANHLGDGAEVRDVLDSLAVNLTQRVLGVVAAIGTAAEPKELSVRATLPGDQILPASE